MNFYSFLILISPMRSSYPRMSLWLASMRYFFTLLIILLSFTTLSQNSFRFPLSLPSTQFHLLTLCRSDYPLINLNRFSRSLWTDSLYWLNKSRDITSPSPTRLSVFVYSQNSFVVRIKDFVPSYGLHISCINQAFLVFQEGIFVVVYLIHET